MDCTIGTERVGELAIVTVAGYIDAHTFEELEEESEGLLEAEVFRIAMDLSKVSYSSSAGIGVLVNIRASCMSGGGGLVLINPAESVSHVMKTFGIWELFTIVPTKAQALETLKAVASAPVAKP